MGLASNHEGSKQEDRHQTHRRMNAQKWGRFSGTTPSVEDRTAFFYGRRFAIGLAFGFALLLLLSPAFLIHFTLTFGEGRRGALSHKLLLRD